MEKESEYIYHNHLAIHLKLTQHYKSTTLQYKKMKEKAKGTLL